MIRIHTDALDPGMLTARPVYDSDGAMLLGKDVILDAFLIQRLKKRGVTSIFIKDESTEEISPKEMISQSVRGSTINDLKRITESFDAIRHEIKRHSIWSVSKLIGSSKFKAVFGDSPVLHDIQNAAKNIVEELLSTDVSLGLNSIKTYGNYLYEHAIDVAVFSIMLGRRLDFSPKRLRELGIGCLLHDMGMTLMPKDIIEKHGNLTAEEREIINLHPELGYELFRDVPVIGVLPPHVAFQHHEHYDGNGYPRNLAGSEKIEMQHEPRSIHLYAAICTIADVYDALASDRPYRTAYPTETVLKIMVGMKGTVLHPKLLNEFLSFAPPFPVGTLVRVSGREFDGYFGIVKDLNAENIARPTLRLVFNADRKRIKPLDLHLIDWPELSIRSIILKKR